MHAFRSTREHQTQHMKSLTPHPPPTPSHYTTLAPHPHHTTFTPHPNPHPHHTHTTLTPHPHHTRTTPTPHHTHTTPKPTPTPHPHSHHTTLTPHHTHTTHTLHQSLHCMNCRLRFKKLEFYSSQHTSCERCIITVCNTTLGARTI